MAKTLRSGRGHSRSSTSFVEPLGLLAVLRTLATRLNRGPAVWLAAVLILSTSVPSEGGGISETIPTDWVVVAPGPGAEIVQFIKDLPHDPTPLGVRAALQRTKTPPATFRPVRFSSVDG